MTTHRAEQIWETFKAELIVEPTEDQRQALVTTIREIVNEFQYYQCCEDEEDMVVDAWVLYALADELENLWK
jgi:hypothetical protein